MILVGKEMCPEHISNLFKNIKCANTVAQRVDDIVKNMLNQLSDKNQVALFGAGCVHGWFRYCSSIFFLRAR